MLLLILMFMLPDTVSVRLFYGRKVSGIRIRSCFMVDGGDTFRFDSLSLRARGGYVAWGNRISREVEVFPIGNSIKLTVGHRTASYPGRLVVRAAGSELEIINFVPLELYLASVVGAEMGCDAPLEALKAQAVLARTFVARGPRHQGFDFCDLTHCLHYGGQGSICRRTLEAVRKTARLVLVDANGRLIVPYFSASNGGRVETPSRIWGESDPAYLHEKRDPFSGGKHDPHGSWRTAINVPALSAIFRHGEISKMEVDTGYRPITVEIRFDDGDVLRIKASDFKIRVNRALGWNKIKMVRFSVSKMGDNFVFSGRGLGHGVGLSQSGAVLMARKGMGFARIIGFYFPGAWLSPTDSPFLFQGGYNEKALSDMKLALSHVEKTICLRHKGRIFVRFFNSTPKFTSTCSVPWWKAAITVGDTICFQPLKALKNKGIYEATLKRELYHVVLNQNAIEIPLWLREGAATCLFEGGSYGELCDATPDDVDKMLQSNDINSFRRGWRCAAGMAARQFRRLSPCQFFAKTLKNGGLP